VRRLAALLLGLAAAACSPPPSAPPPSSGPLTALAPKGDVALPFVFRWDGAGPSTVVHVRVYDDAERPLYLIEARGSEAPAPKDLRGLLRPGQDYQWKVMRVDENGEEADASPPVTFAVSP
jgi:hypothetical protein